jgi:hypothetical protein
MFIKIENLLNSEALVSVLSFDENTLDFPKTSPRGSFLNREK